MYLLYPAMAARPAKPAPIDMVQIRKTHLRRAVFGYDLSRRVDICYAYVEAAGRIRRQVPAAVIRQTVPQNGGADIRGDRPYRDVQRLSHFVSLH